ncbi:hypothetical protein CDO73_20840 [Saccharibacillus sp. O23]|uniref:hypothetical protein n=1 Tax=Saccharibacillus sp. O23 TaxID=2009338 RepID=UPI000B4E0AC3|nr:hypothetical protein [Saccharibacillus sp. O23]OWR27801.1 hypothetical protein CDO73_20840 [Saccharibacillus sp. O23]
MLLLSVIPVVMIASLLAYRWIVQKFEKYHKENVGLSIILIVFVTSSYNILGRTDPMPDWVKFAVIALVVLAAYSAVINSIRLGRYEKKTL